jgi:adenylate kinase
LKVYNEQTAPLLDYYTNKGLIKTINGQGDIAVIKNNILEVLA